VRINIKSNTRHVSLAKVGIESFEDGYRRICVIAVFRESIYLDVWSIESLIFVNVLLIMHSPIVYSKMTLKNAVRF